MPLGGEARQKGMLCSFKIIYCLERLDDIIGILSKISGFITRDLF